MGLLKITKLTFFYIKTRFTRYSAHIGIEGNELADALAQSPWPLLVHKSTI